MVRRASTLSPGTAAARFGYAFVGSGHAVQAVREHPLNKLSVKSGDEMLMWALSQLAPLGGACCPGCLGEVGRREFTQTGN